MPCSLVHRYLPNKLHGGISQNTAISAVAFAKISNFRTRHPVYLRFLLILFFLLHIGLSTILFRSFFPTKMIGRAVAKAVSRRLPTAAARVRVRRACGVCGGQSGGGAGFLRVLRFPLPTIIPPVSPSS
jgi:hypothetical protein